MTYRKPYIEITANILSHMAGDRLIILRGIDEE